MARDNWDGIEDFDNTSPRDLVDLFLNGGLDDMSMTVHDTLRFIKIADALFKDSPGNVNVQVAFSGDSKMCYDDSTEYIRRLQFLMMRVNSSEYPFQVTPNFKQAVLQRLELVIMRYRAMYRLAVSFNVLRAPNIYNAMQEHTASKITGLSFDVSDAALTDAQRLIMEMLNDLANIGARKDDSGFMYVPRITDAGDFAFTHVPLVFNGVHMDVNAYMYRCMADDTQKWVGMTKGARNYNAVYTDLINTRDYRFPFLKTCRSRWSFRNGVFDVKTCEFTPYGHPDIDKLNRYESSVKFFDVDFEIDRYREEMMGDDNQPNPMRIKTPFTDQIGISQRWSGMVMKWFYTLFFGRNFHPINECEKWEICVLLDGLAGTGKSTSLKLLQHFFTAPQVGILSASGRANFPLETIKNAFIVMCGECAHMDLDVEYFKLLVEGADVVIHEMRKKSLQMTWTAPIVLSGNGPPPYNGEGGAVARRIVSFIHKYSVRQVDTTLYDNMKNETAAVMYKSALLYKMAHETYGRQGIWTRGILPPELHRNNERIRSKVNPIYAVVFNNERFVLGDDCHMTYRDLKIAVADFCEGGHANKRTDEAFNEVFETVNIRRVDPLVGADVAPDPYGYTEPYLVGICPVGNAPAVGQVRPRDGAGPADDRDPQRRRLN